MAARNLPGTWRNNSCKLNRVSLTLERTHNSPLPLFYTMSKVVFGMWNPQYTRSHQFANLGATQWAMCPTTWEKTS